MTRPDKNLVRKLKMHKKSTQIKDATISDLVSANKIVKFIKNTPTKICIPTLHFESLYIKLILDASFNNLPNSRSQGGFLVFPSDKFNYIAPIAWSSTKLKHVA